jgi:hypothetical protein
MLKESYIHPYTGYHGCAAFCHIAVYEHAGKTVVVCTESEDNPGTSITNMAEYLATDIWHDLGSPPLDQFIWVEHYLDRGYVGGRPLFKEDFDLVTFTAVAPRFEGPLSQQHDTTVLRAPDWERIDQADVEHLIGEPYAAPDLSSEVAG